MKMPTVALPALFLLLSLFGRKTAVPINNFKGMLFRNCEDGQVFSMVESEYGVFEKDRRWNFGCTDFKELPTCWWTEYFYLSENEINFNCPANHVINGFYSNYDSDTGERHWQFYCCTASNLVTFDCRETPMLNYFKEDFSWLVPGDNLLTGVTTHFSNGDGDHRWGFSYCRGTELDGDTVTSAILTSNTAVSNYMTEGDVRRPMTRNAKICSNCKWPKENGHVQVPYRINDTFSDSEIEIIKKSMESFHLSTCVRFVPQNGHNSWISIVKSTGCWSWVGRLSGKQELSLGTGCMTRGIIQHELIHALGFWHEQSRSDRDIYVNIHLENVQDGEEGNFDRHETNNLNVPYDYSSLMHYGRRDFTKNGHDTITPVFNTDATLGQRIGMTENDILKINKLYSCEAYLHNDGVWENDLGEDFSFQCPSGQALSQITSSYDSQGKDRNWTFKCKAFEETTDCKWSMDANNYATGMDFQCESGRAITGVQSEFNSETSDRKWKFYCCKPSFSLTQQQQTPTINYWHEYFSWKVAGNNFITGINSNYDSQKRDRRWSFKYSQRQS